MRTTNGDGTFRCLSSQTVYCLDLLLWDGDDQCEWWIAPRNIDHARALLDLLPFEAETPGWLHEIRPEGIPALRDWRASSRSS